MSDRKYSQKGYQDSDRDRGASRRDFGRPSSAPRREGAPRGRGLGKPTATVMRCAVCGTMQDAGGIEPASTCSKCKTDLHTCTHCTHFDSGAVHQCRQPIELPIRSKAKRNGCGLFAPRLTQEQARDSDRPDDAKSAFDALFDF